MPGSDNAATLVSGGITRHYSIHIPSHYQASTPLPLMIALAADGMTVLDGTATYQLTPESNAQTFILVYAQGSPGSDVNQTLGWDSYFPWDFGYSHGNKWQGVDDVSFLNTLEQTVVSETCVNLRHVGMVGMSGGGAMTDMMACTDQPWLTSIVSVAAYPPQNTVECSYNHRIPFIAVNGMRDPIVPWNGFPPSAPPVPTAYANEAPALSACTGGSSESSASGTVDVWTYQGCLSFQPNSQLAGDTAGGHQWPGGRPLTPPSQFGPYDGSISTQATAAAFVAAAVNPLTQPAPTPTPTVAP